MEYDSYPKHFKIDIRWFRIQVSFKPKKGLDPLLFITKKKKKKNGNTLQRMKVYIRPFVQEPSSQYQIITNKIFLREKL